MVEDKKKMINSIAATETFSSLFTQTSSEVVAEEKPPIKPEPKFALGNGFNEPPQAPSFPPQKTTQTENTEKAFSRNEQFFEPKPQNKEHQSFPKNFPVRGKPQLPPEDRTSINSNVRNALNAWRENNLDLAETIFCKGLVLLYSKARSCSVELQPLYLFEIAKILHNRGLIARQKSLYLYARKYFSRAFMIFLKLGIDRPEVFTILVSSAQLYVSEGQPHHAIPLLSRAMKVYAEKYTENSFAVFNVIIDFFLLNCKLKNYKTAVEFAEKALRYSKEMPFLDELNIFRLKLTLASVYEKMDSFEKAYNIHLDLLHVLERRYGKKHPNVLKHLMTIARMLETRQEFPKAEAVYKRCIADFFFAFGRNSLEAAFAISSLATLYVTNGKLNEAMCQLLKSLNIRKKVMGENNPIVGENYSKLAIVHWSCCRFIEAESYMSKAAAVFGSSLGMLDAKTRQAHRSLESIRCKEPVDIQKPF